MIKKNLKLLIESLSVHFKKQMRIMTLKEILKNQTKQQIPLIKKANPIKKLIRFYKKIENMALIKNLIKELLNSQFKTPVAMLILYFYQKIKKALLSM